MDTLSHLRGVDESRWPAIASPPVKKIGGIKANRAEARFAKSVAAAGLTFAENDISDGDILVEQDVLFVRLADAGWVGLMEGYAAGEFLAHDLAHVLEKLLAHDTKGVGCSPRLRSHRVWDGGEPPVALFGVGSATGGYLGCGRFASGVATTAREKITARPSSRSCFAFVTRVSDPVEVGVEDLAAAENRAVDDMLDALSVGKGTELVEFPSSGPLVSEKAASRGANVDVFTADKAMAKTVFDAVTSRSHGRINVGVSTKPHSPGSQWQAQYDAAICMEKLELGGDRQKRKQLAEYARLLRDGGTLGVQCLVATPKLGPSMTAAIGGLQCYIWPGLSYVTAPELVGLINQTPGLVVTTMTTMPGHAAASLRLKRKLFEGSARRAAAAGIDQVTRRLWDYQLALREALVRLGALELVTITAEKRPIA